jgi:hypothetical protein
LIRFTSGQERLHDAGIVIHQHERLA